MSMVYVIIGISSRYHEIQFMTRSAIIGVFSDFEIAKNILDVKVFALSPEIKVTKHEDSGGYDIIVSSLHTIQYRIHTVKVNKEYDGFTVII